MNNKYPIAYAAYNKDLETRISSTSGGIFSAIAEYFFDNYSAVIYGCVFDDSFNVVHQRITLKEDICKARGSKYSQSNLGDSFKLVKKDLLDGRYVFFTGTPCQISGLKNYLGKEYEKLYTLDFVCHGVASPKVWKSYVKELSKKGTINRITVKSKIKGWRKWYFKVDYLDAKTFKIRGSMNVFIRSYSSYTNIRNSCYECHFKGLNRISDFTVSDCWGLGEKNKRLNDDKGLSALLINNSRAYDIFNLINDVFEYEEYDPISLMKENWTTFHSVPKPENREQFFKSVNTLSPYRALKKEYAPKMVEWIKYYWNVIKGNEK